MRSQAAIRALNDYNQARSASKKDAVRATVIRLSETSGDVTQAQVARVAGVSREFINNHPELKALIRAAARLGEEDTPATESNSDARGRGLVDQNRTFAAALKRQKQTIAEMRATIERLNHQRELYLGAQLAANMVDADTHQRLQLDRDRHAAENQQYRLRIEEMQRRIDRLTDDLNASRQAHAEDVARPSARENPQNATVISLVHAHSWDERQTPAD